MNPAPPPRNGRPQPAKLADYPWREQNILRYSDLDGHGHVNNAVFATFFEAARLPLLVGPNAPLQAPGLTYVLARIEIDFLGEIRWPGEVTTGIRVARIGNSSIVFDEALFVNELCVGRSLATVVLIDATTRHSRPLPPELAAKIKTTMLPATPSSGN